MLSRQKPDPISAIYPEPEYLVEGRQCDGPCSLFAVFFERR